MPVIEQAKEIIMVHCGWPEDQAFDALRRASQRENIKVRDLAAQIVAQTARAASAQWLAGPARAAAPASEEVTHARAPAATAACRLYTARKYSSRNVLQLTRDDRHRLCDLH